MLITEFRNGGDAAQDHWGRGRHCEVGEAGGRGQRQVERQQEEGPSRRLTNGSALFAFLATPSKVRHVTLYIPSNAQFHLISWVRTRKFVRQFMFDHLTLHVEIGTQISQISVIQEQNKYKLPIYQCLTLPRMLNLMAKSQPAVGVGRKSGRGRTSNVDLLHSPCDGSGFGSLK